MVKDKVESARNSSAKNFSSETNKASVMSNANVGLRSGSNLIQKHPVLKETEKAYDFYARNQAALQNSVKAQYLNQQISQHTFGPNKNPQTHPASKLVASEISKPKEQEKALPQIAKNN